MVVTRHGRIEAQNFRARSDQGCTVTQASKVDLENWLDCFTIE